MTYTVQNTSNIIAGHTIQPADLLNNFNLIVTTFSNIAQTSIQAQLSSNQDSVALSPATGIGYCALPWACVINGWTIVSPVSGSIIIDVLQAGAAQPLGSFTSITGSTKPTLASQQYATGTSLSGWTTSLSQNTILRFDIVSASTTGYALFNLNITRAS